MAGETVITIIGNLTADPELRTLSDGNPVASFTIASTPRTYNRRTQQYEDGTALFLRCSAWNDLARHISQSCSKGMRVVAQGRLSQHSYQAHDGSNRTSMGQLNDIEIDICPDCAQRFNDQTIGTIHIRRDHRDKLSPYLLEYQSTDLKEDQA